MAVFNDYISEVQSHVSRLSSKEQMAGKGLLIPFNATNSGSRKIMDIVHQDHALVLSRGEVPFVGTGYENLFGDKSSSIIKLDKEYQVFARIPKFSDAPNHDYYLILQSVYTNELHVIERVAYRYITEIYGYLHNNSMMDNLSNYGTTIYPDQVLRRSTGFDQFGNKTNGLNLNVTYLSLDDNMEDSILISESCSKKMRAPFLKKVKKIINENDIPLNLYGNNGFYKVFPDIGEDIKNGILFAFRREDKENAIYAQSVSRLQQVMMSDDKTTLKGKVIDIDIYCNNPANLADSLCNSQFYKYFANRQRFCNEIVSVVGSLLSQGYTMTYDLQKLFTHCKDELSGKEFTDKRKFSNIIMEFVIMEERDLDVGDKVADRFGGKGVVSKVLPDFMMPMRPDGTRADMIKNSHTMSNRENPGQIFELTENFVSNCILNNIRSSHMEAEEALDIILRYLHIVSPDEEMEMREYTSHLREDDLKVYVSTILEYECIHLSSEPISDRMDIDLLGELYEAFPWIDLPKPYVPIKDSNGNYRQVPARRSVIIGKQYIYRLKQVSEEKFSATSLSSTNIKSENAKSKASKNYREPYSNTPIRFGPMESGDMEHMGAEVVVFNLMMYSTSPHGRRLSEEMYTGDPYNINIRLNSKAKNRSVEQMNAKLKTMGYRMKFDKRKKKYVPAFTIDAISFDNNPGTGVNAIEFMSPDYDYDHWYKTQAEIEKKVKENKDMKPGLIFGADS